MNTSRFGKAQREETSAGPSAYKSCCVCHQQTKHEDLMTFGARCKPCFESYCRQAPDYIHAKATYIGDPKAWARRLIDRHKAGETLRPISLRYAREALKIEVAA